MKRIVFCIFLVPLFCLSGQVAGQMPGAPASPLESAHRDKLIGNLSEQLTEVYVFPEVAENMVELINTRNEQGAYDQFLSLAAFTDQLTEDLQSISHDKHLNIQAVPPPRGKSGETLSEQQMAARQLARAKAVNFGFEQISILPGNIGYLDLRMFYGAEDGGPTAIAAMNFLANSAALIFDLRKNGGGDPSMIQLISSYLFDESKHLNTFFIRRSNSTEQYWTQASVQGPKMVVTPVYLLTSNRTFSAAEEFTYNLKNMKRATVVGETTGGGAHPVDMVFADLGDGLFVRMSIPFGRAINPITGTNWEGTGVTPHVEVPAADALDVAQLMILDELLLSEADPDRKLELEGVKDELASKRLDCVK